MNGPGPAACAPAPPTPARAMYARALDRLVRLGMGFMLAVFCFYAMGIGPCRIRPETLSFHWSLSLHEFLTATGTGQGWCWIRDLRKLDHLSLMSIIFMAFITVICYIRILPYYFKVKNRIYALICSIQIIVLLLAASGLLKAGH